MADTREALLRAAENLFAEKGLDGTSVREINRLAGQRNTSAVRYHFQGMDGLLETLVRERMSALDSAREEALADLDPQRASVRDYVGALLLPLAERAESDAAWASWVQVLAQLVSVRGRAHRALWEGRYDRNARRIFSEIRSRLPEIPDRLWRQRVDDLMLLCVGSLCERVASRKASPRAARVGAATFQQNLVVTSTALLQAPAPGDQ